MAGRKYQEEFDKAIKNLKRRVRNAEKKGLKVDIDEDLFNMPDRLTKQRIDKINNENMKNWKSHDRVYNATPATAELDALIEYISNYDGEYEPKGKPEILDEMKRKLLDFLDAQMQKAESEKKVYVIGANERFWAEDFAVGYFQASRQDMKSAYYRQFCEVVIGRYLTWEEIHDYEEVSDYEEIGLDEEIDYD